MHTGSTIIAIVTAALIVAVAVAAAIVLLLGPRLGISTLIVVLAFSAIVYTVSWKPRMVRWGTTGDESSRSMPGDELVRGASTKTNAISIVAAPRNVWPWLVQIGFNKAGWYSYDWIDNDGKPSADRILPEHQVLATGDAIDMAPGMRLIVTSVGPQSSIVSVSSDGTMSWCLSLHPTGKSTTRLVSRWRLRRKGGPAAVLFMPIIEIGSFIMERKMLLGIKERAEKMQATANYVRSAEMKSV